MIAFHTIDESLIEETAALIRDAFAPVARLFALTPLNCPTHPSLATAETVERALARGTRFSVARDESDRLLGVVGTRPPRNGVVALEKPAVRPAFQGRGVGGALLSHARRISDGADLEASIIDGHDALAAWYERRGFRTARLVRPDGLPFTVRVLIYPGDASKP